MEQINAALANHFKRYLNTLSVPLADQEVFGESENSPYARFKPVAASLQQSLSMPMLSNDTLWREAVTRLQQSQPALTPWPGALCWQTALGRLQQGLAGEESLLPEDLLDASVEEDLLALPDMPESDDLFDMEGSSSELDALFGDVEPAPAATPAPTPSEMAADADDINAAVAAVDDLVDQAVASSNPATATPQADAKTQAADDLFTEMPWEASEASEVIRHEVAASPKEEATHIHVPAGQDAMPAGQLSDHAPQAAQNPILAATQQALKSAETAAAEQSAEVAVASSPVADSAPSLDPKTHNSKEFFSSLPWGGKQSA